MIELNVDERRALEAGHHHGKSPAFRKRCQTILLKSEGRSSKQVGGIVKMHQVSVNTWMDRYEAEGIDGLLTKPGRGRKPLLDAAQHGPDIIEAVKANRQSLKAAKAAFEASQTSKAGVNGEDSSQQAQQILRVSDDTLRRFLKELTADTNA